MVLTTPRVFYSTRFHRGSIQTCFWSINTLKWADTSAERLQQKEARTWWNWTCEIMSKCLLFTWKWSNPSEYLKVVVFRAPHLIRHGQRCAAGPVVSAGLPAHLSLLFCWCSRSEERRSGAAACWSGKKNLAGAVASLIWIVLFQSKCQTCCWESSVCFVRFASRHRWISVTLSAEWELYPAFVAREGAAGQTIRLLAEARWLLSHWKRKTDLFFHLR